MSATLYVPSVSVDVSCHCQHKRTITNEGKDASKKVFPF